VLRWFYEWCDVSNIRIEERLRNGEILTKAEITGFCRYLRASRNRSIVGSIGKHNKKKEESSVIVSPETFNSYASVCEGFLLWAAYEFIPVNTPEGVISETFAAVIKRIERSFRIERKGGHTALKRHGLSWEEVEEVRQIIKPGSRRNPFKKAVQFRNHIIFELMLATGIRRGELLKIKSSHLPIGRKTTLSIVKSPDDKADPRRNEPQVKTRMREIPLRRTLSVGLWKYMQSHRKKNGNGQYLFTSTRGGHPLTLGGVNWIFSFLVKKRLPHLKGRLSPHTLRHTYNELFVEFAIEQGCPESRIKDMQRYLNGWSEQSNMPTRYTRRVIEGEARKIEEQFQDSLYIF
jgi:integrase